MTENTHLLKNWLLAENKKVKVEDGIEPTHYHLSQEQDELIILFKNEDPKLWLWSWLNSGFSDPEKKYFFLDWNNEQLQCALDFFSATPTIQIINTIFYFKLFPEKLFEESIHPEKLISLRIRLSLLHKSLVQIYYQLKQVALKKGLNTGVDFLFHEEGFPKGISINLNSEYKELIQNIIKNMNSTPTLETTKSDKLEYVRDFARAYKYWFNPNRLIDAVMVLHSLFLSQNKNDSCNAGFCTELRNLYKQLSTTECLDLYGYFSNNDTRYLLYTILYLSQGNSFNWLPEVTSLELATLQRVYQLLKSVMDALREELESRHIATEPYQYKITKENFEVGQRNREAVIRAIEIYGHETGRINTSIENLFNLLEDN